MVRLHYLDNLRWIAILLLFPFHAAFIFCAGFYGYYVQSDQALLPAHLITVTIEPWIMPLLFCIAGMGMRFALQERTPRTWVQERIRKLLVPFIAGVVLVCPVISYYALKFHSGYQGDVPGAFVHFFTSARFDRYPAGIFGDFSVDHLWFILFLFIFSLIALCMVLAGRSLTTIRLPAERTGTILLVLLFVPVWLLNSAGTNVTGYSFPAYFLVFLAGYGILAEDPVQARLEKHRAGLLATWLVLTAGGMWLYGLLLSHHEVFWGSSAIYVLTGWTGVLALMGAGRHWLNIRTGFTASMSAASYPVYIIHQAVLVAVGWYVLLIAIPPALQYAAIVLAAIALTFACYGIVRRIPGVRALFGIAVPPKSPAR